MRNCDEITISPFEFVFKKGETIKYIYFIQSGDVELKLFENEEMQPSIQI